MMRAAMARFACLVLNLLLFGQAAAQAPMPTFVLPPCLGDCDRTHDVTIADIILMTNVVLGGTPLSACVAGDGDGDGAITVDEIVAAVAMALNGCPESPRPPTGEFLCSAGANDGVACNADD